MFPLHPKIFIRDGHSTSRNNELHSQCENNNDNELTGPVTTFVQGDRKILCQCTLLSNFQGWANNGLMVAGNITRGMEWYARHRGARLRTISEFNILINSESRGNDKNIQWPLHTFPGQEFRVASLGVADPSCIPWGGVRPCYPVSLDLGWISTETYIARYLHLNI